MERNITLRIIGDNILEEDEEFILELSVPIEEPVDLLETNHRAVIIILNDDGMYLNSDRHTKHIVQVMLSTFLFMQLSSFALKVQRTSFKKIVQVLL